MRTLDDVLDQCGTTMEFANAVGNVRPDSRGVSGDTPLHIVCSWGDVEAARLLLAAGAEVNAAGDLGRTPLFSATSSDNLELLGLLVTAGADLSHKDEFGNTAYDVAKSVEKANEILAVLRPTKNC